MSLTSENKSAFGEALHRLQEIDAICDQFEAAWLQGSPPALDEFLAAAPEPTTNSLLRELLAIELEYRRDDAGRRLSAREIVELYPDLTRGIADQFCRLPTVRIDDNGNASDNDSDDHSANPPGAAPSTGLHIRCPHCQNAVELLEDSALEEITCRSCGSNFTLVGAEPDEAAPAKKLERIGRFELLKLLGMGGFGAVWKARDGDLDRCVALKIPRRGQISRTEAELFFREARAAAQLRHPNIVPVHEVGRDGDTIFIVSDLIRGEPLSAQLKTALPPFRETATLLAKVADALESAHQRGVVHRDLKPSNIMIDDAGEPYLMDFGLAKRQFGEVTMTVEGQVLGTPAYMSPEQAAGETKWIDRRTDIYSFGAMLFQMLTGELPFRGSLHSQIRQRLEDDPPSPRRLNGRVPEDLATICLKCLERDPNKRYAAAEQVGEELRRWLRGEPIHARPISPVSRAARWAKRNPALAAIAALVSVLAISGPTAAAVIYSQLRALETRRTESAELINRRDARQERDAKMIQSLTSERDRLAEANPAAVLLPKDWRKSLAVDYLKKHSEQAAQQIADLPADSANRAQAHRALGQLLEVAGRTEEAIDQRRQAHKIWSDRLAGGADDDKSALAGEATALARLLDGDDGDRFAKQALSLRNELAGYPGASLRARVERLYSTGDYASRQTRRFDQSSDTRPQSIRLVYQLTSARGNVRASWSASPESVIEVAESLDIGP